LSHWREAAKAFYDSVRRLARMTHLYEITPWMLPADAAAEQLGAARQCAPETVALCAARARRYLYDWYARQR
jgi:hypothetical protein